MTTEHPIKPPPFATMQGNSPPYNRRLSGACREHFEWKEGISMQYTKPKFAFIGNTGGVQ